MGSPVKVPAFRGLRQLVADSLREAILSGALKPGERLRENELAKTLNVSRSPLREAIRELEREGLVVTVPNKGATVVRLSPADVSHIYAIRASLETLAARWAAENATDEELRQVRLMVDEGERLLRTGNAADLRRILHVDFAFHALLLKLARSELLARLLTSLHHQIRMVMNTGVRTLTVDRCRSIVEEHRALVNALEQRDAAAAERLMRAHIEAARVRISLAADSQEHGSEQEGRQRSEVERR